MENITINKTLEKTLQMMEAFALEGLSMNVAEISRYMDVSRITAQAIVNTLELYDYIEKDSETGRYSYGFKMLTLGNRYLYKYPFLLAAQKHMERMSNEKNFTINVSILKPNGKMIYLLLKDVSSVPLIYTGACLSANLTASGKIILANMDEEKRNNFIDSMEFVAATPYSIMDKELFKKQLADYKARGYAIEKEEAITGSGCIAAPIYDIQGRAIAAVSVSDKVSKISEKEEEIAADVLTLSRQISMELGYQPMFR